jgi:hypothetical protein
MIMVPLPYYALTTVCFKILNNFLRTGGVVHSVAGALPIPNLFARKPTLFNSTTAHA